MEFLAKYRDPHSIEALKKIACDSGETQDIRIMAMDFLGQAGELATNEMVKFLVDVAGNQDEEDILARHKAGIALHQFQSDELVSIAEDFLRVWNEKGQEFDWRGSFIWSVSQLRSEQAVRFLLGLVSGQRENDRRFAGHKLAKMCGAWSGAWEYVKEHSRSMPFEILLECARFAGHRVVHPKFRDRIVRQREIRGASPQKKTGASTAMEPPVDFVIITPLSEECDAVLRKLGNHTKTNPSEEDTRVYYTSSLAATFPDGSSSTYRIAVASLADVGRVEAATATNDAIRRWRPQFVILVGIAGGYRDADVQLGDLLIPTQIVDYEKQKFKNDGTKIRWQGFRVNTRLLNEARSFRSDDWKHCIDTPRPRQGYPQVHYGIVFTGDKVIANDLLSEYQRTWDCLIGVEMEAGGTALAAFQAPGAPGFFMIRGVSDLADPTKNTKLVEKWRAYACDVAASFTIAFLQSGPVPANPQ